MHNEPILRVHNISKSFRTGTFWHRSSKQVLNNLSFEIYKGEIFGILGNNGAGKTTTLRIISTLLNQDSGDIYYNGIKLTEAKAEIRKNICFLTDELKLEPSFTPDYMFDYFCKLYGVSDDICKQRKQSLFERLELNAYATQKIGSLSTGTKQKVAIAIALSHDPEIVIFDEPTNGLDIFTAKFVVDYLLELKDLGKTVIITTHIFDVIEKTCDRVGIMIDGYMASEDALPNILQGYDRLENYFYKKHREVKGI